MKFLSIPLFVTGSLVVLIVMGLAFTAPLSLNQYGWILGLGFAVGVFLALSGIVAEVWQKRSQQSKEKAKDEKDRKEKDEKEREEVEKILSDY